MTLQRARGTGGACGLILFAITSCSTGDQPGSSGTSSLTLADLASVTISGGGGEEGEAILHSPVDGRLLPDAHVIPRGIAILDASEPWIRVYDENGRFVQAMGREGRGPGEARSPFSLGHSGSGFLLFQQGRVLEVDASGSAIEERADGAHLWRGGVDACGGRVLFGVPMGQGTAPPGFLVLRRAATTDTLMVTGGYRWQAGVHPFFIALTRTGFVFFPEEVERTRLVEVSCSEGVLGDFAVESVGPPERWERLESSLAVHPPELPFPGGVAWTAGTVFWAVRDTLSGGKPVTRLTARKADGVSATLSIEDWFILVDSDFHGRLLFLGDSPMPAAHIVDADRILELLEEG